jgi:hypothetical protein
MRLKTCKTAGSTASTGLQMAFGTDPVRLVTGFIIRFSTCLDVLSRRICIVGIAVLATLIMTSSATAAVNIRDPMNVFGNLNMQGNSISNATGKVIARDTNGDGKIDTDDIIDIAFDGPGLDSRAGFRTLSQSSSGDSNIATPKLAFRLPTDGGPDVIAGGLAGGGSVDMNQRQLTNLPAGNSPDNAATVGQVTPNSFEPVSTCRELMNLAGKRKSARLENDINCSRISQYRSKGFKPISGFKGSLDGDNHKITGLEIDRPDQNNVGLFGRLAADSPTTLMVQDLVLDEPTVKGKDDVGALVGSTGFSADYEIRNVTVLGGTVIGEDNVGGIAGDLDEARIVRSSSSSKIAPARGSTTQSGLDESLGVDAGGLAGQLGGRIVGSRFSGFITDGKEDPHFTVVGGIAGRSTGTVSRSHVEEGARIEGYANIGGLIGENSGRVVNSSVGIAAVESVGITVNINNEDEIQNQGVGALVGRNSGVVAENYAVSDPETRFDGDDLIVAGLVGENKVFGDDREDDEGVVKRNYMIGGSKQLVKGPDSDLQSVTNNQRVSQDEATGDSARNSMSNLRFQRDSDPLNPALPFASGDASGSGVPDITDRSGFRLE